MTASDYIRVLNLSPHPEGGYFRESYRSRGSIPAEALVPLFNGQRQYSTAIYFLLNAGDYSAFHRIRSDECWHFYAGGPLAVHMLDSEGNYRLVKVGNDVINGQLFQYVVRANTWFASEPDKGTSFSLVRCTVSPGFDFQDFEMAKSNQLAARYPDHRELIERLCR